MQKNIGFIYRILNLYHLIIIIYKVTFSESNEFTTFEIFIFTSLSIYKIFCFFIAYIDSKENLEK